MIGLNIPENIWKIKDRNLHLIPNHPISIIKKRIQSFFGEEFKCFDSLDPIVEIYDNFDSLLIPKDHVSRSVSDTYYLDNNKVLRTHTSAHQTYFLNKKEERFLVSGPVFRRDEIDSSHYPVFHQMEGVKIIPNASKEDIEKDLLSTLSSLVSYLFPECTYEITNSYFPFTEPSFEFEVNWNDKKLEVLGCGVIHQEILSNCKVSNLGWAFGLGLERLAMILFEIPDIRLFWSKDDRFLSQFKEGEITKFQPYSKYPLCYKDISFWEPDNYSPNDFYEHVRNVFGDLAESVVQIDKFTNKNGKTSYCYRINCRSLDRSLLNNEVNNLNNLLRDNLILEGYEIR